MASAVKAKGKPNPEDQAKVRRTVQDVIEAVQIEMRSILVNVEWERYVLGTMLLNQNTAYEVIASLDEEDFWLSAHRLIFEILCEMVSTGEELTVITLVKRLEERKLLEVVGGAVYVSSLTDIMRYPSTKRFTEGLKTATKRRRAVEALVGGILMLADPSESAESALSSTEARLIEAMASQTSSNEPKLIGSYFQEWSKEFNEVRSHTRKTIGMSYGVDALNDSTTGMRPAEVTVVAGRPGDGKSSFALQSALDNCEDDKDRKAVPVYYASAEMGGKSLFSRTLSRFSKVNNLKLRNGSLEFFELEQIDSAIQRMDKLPLYIDDCRQLDIDRICGRVRVMVRRGGVKLAIFDYAQILKAPGRDMQERTAYVSHAIADLARSENIPVMLLSQIGRKKDRAGKVSKNSRPTLDDLKWSGALEEDADVVVLIFRGAGTQEYEDELIVAKQRNGPTGPEKVRFDPDTLRFCERT